MPLLRWDIPAVPIRAQPNKPQVTVTLGKKTVPASEYVVTYANNINAGTAKVTITATASSASYTGSIVKTFTINKASKQIKVKKTSIAKTYGNSAFSLGASVTGKEKLTYSLSNKTVIKIVSGKAKDCRLRQGNSNSEIRCIGKLQGGSK